MREWLWLQQQLLVWSLAQFGLLRDVLHVCKGFLRLSARCCPFLEHEKSTKKKVSCWEQVLWEIGAVLVLGCSGILVLYGAVHLVTTKFEQHL
jgi:hypothetical protein